MDPVIVIATFTPKMGATESFLEIMSPLVEASRLESGNQTYDLYSDASGRFHLIERYIDSAALDFHRNTNHYKVYRSVVEDSLDGNIEVKLLSEHDVVNPLGQIVEET